MISVIKITVILLAAVFFASCKEYLSSLQLVQEQSTGGFKVSVLSDDGTIKQGSGMFVVEFRSMSDSSLVKVGSVSAEAEMHMRGNPMKGETSIEFTDIPGRYNVKYNFPMKGSWLYTVFFNTGLMVQFTLDVQ